MKILQCFAGDKNMQKILIFILSILFVLFSFSPSLYEILHIKDLPPERVFVLEHNYMFDYNFYLSRIREGQEGYWLVTEKYYNEPHPPSFFQIVYLYLGKIGGILGLAPPFVYHAARIVGGFILLVITGLYLFSLFPGWWSIIVFLLIVTAGSWPVPMKLADGSLRLGTYMGWWSVIDSLQRITIIPHVLFGQIGLLLFVGWFSSKSLKELMLLKMLTWGLLGFIIGIIFPPTLVVVYVYFCVITLFEMLMEVRFRKSLRLLRLLMSLKNKEWIIGRIIPRVIFVLLSFPSLVYAQLMFRIWPWKALALFDIQHRMPLPYKEYLLTLGPVLPLGLIGLVWALFKKEKKLLPPISWVIAVFLLFAIFERVPTQSPLRFTEAAVHIPLGILGGYLFYQLFHLSDLSYLGYLRRKLIKTLTFFSMITLIFLGLAVMISMVGWLTDQAVAKRKGTWLVPIGVQLLYPLKDFMDAVYFLRDNTRREEVVLAYVTAGNFIPAYAGNYVYIGHANTPDEDGKEKIAAKFFAGQMTQDEAKNFLQKEKISYIFFGPQEKELGKVDDLTVVYPFLTLIYRNQRVALYK